MAAPKRKRDFLEFLNGSGDPADILLTPHARDLLFDTILHQLATSSLFSNSNRAPNIFVVYAHGNQKEGDAYDACVRMMISWLKEINAQILSDQSPMPLHRLRIEGTGAIHNILQNQICLLPAKNDDNFNRIPTATSVDKVIVCGSEVLEHYYGKPSALSYIEEIIQICVDGADQAKIKARVEAECRNDKDFHHILTELAFLEFRKSRRSEQYSMVPIMLSQKSDEAPMQYLPMFDKTDVKLKLKSPAASDVHKLFFKLLEQLFPTDGEFIRPFQQCYESISNKLNLEREITREWFNNMVSRGITDTYQSYWTRFCVAVRDGKLQAYTGKLGHDVVALQNMQDVQTTHKILKWLSPVPALERHGRFHNKGTSRLEGTCNWIIQDKEFLQWYDSEGSKLLILCGNIGTGKTYSTSRVIDWVQNGLSTNENSEGLAHCYCNKQDNKPDDPCHILRNIIRQLATGPWAQTSTGAINTVHKKVFQLWEAAKGTGIPSTFSQWEECLVALINTYPRTTIVLDALDECGEVEQSALIELLVNLASPESKCKPVKIFVSTRPEVLHKHHLNKYPTIEMHQNHYANDIAAFVRTKIADHSRWSKMTMQFQTEIVDTLLEKSGDMFLFASLQIQQLLCCDTEPDLRECLDGLPRSLEETYKQIYQQATTRGKDRKRLLDRALRWVHCAARPLTTDELLFAISQDFESHSLVPLRRDLDEAWMSNLCHSFLSLVPGRDHNKAPDDSSNGASVWQLAHQAVADFLEKSDLCESSCANYQAGTICLMVMLDTFGDSPSGGNYDPYGNSKGLRGLQCPCGVTFGTYDSHDELSKPLAEYATHAWAIHLRALKSHKAYGSDHLFQTLQKFLGDASGTSLAYGKWREHTDLFYCHEWSIFSKRTPPPSSLQCTCMSQISLASYLGFSFLLNKCLTTSSVELENSFCAYSWTPWYGVPSTIPVFRDGLVRWSLLALACAHNETEILDRLLEKRAGVDTTNVEEVPPIVAATIGHSKEAAEVMLNRGTEICSSFTKRHGHILSLAIKCESLKVLPLLLDHIRRSSNPTEIERGLSEVSILDFRSKNTIKVMLGAEVKVDVPLKDGTMLMAAIHHGWEDLVRQLLKQGADVNMRFGDLRDGRYVAYHDALEASLKHSSHTMRGQLDSLVYLLIDEPQTRVDAKHLGWACEFKRSNLVLQKLVEHHPDLNETYTLNSNITSALIQAVDSGRNVWDTTLNPLGSIIKALMQRGASLNNLTGNGLNIALAATAHAGLEDMVRECLKLGADPNSFCDHKYSTALGAAAASDSPRAPDILCILLDNGADINAYFPTSSNGPSAHNALALDFPLQAMLEWRSTTNTGVGFYRRLEAKLRLAEILVSKGAIWDIDVAQWRRCLYVIAYKFSNHHTKSINNLLQMLEENRSKFFKSVPEETHKEQWGIKDTGLDNCWKRPILGRMQAILREK